MYLHRLSAVNFKNIAEADLWFCPKINCFMGDNGAGKTNLIDAVHYLSMCKSAFNLTDGQSVRHGEEFFVAEGQYVMNGDRRETVSCSFKKGGGKTVKRNGKEYEKLSEHIGLLPVVMVSPSDTSLIHESGEDRRRFLNSLLSQLDREYLAALIRYNKVLAERNRLLKICYGGSTDVLEVFDMQLAEAGTLIHRKRDELIAKLAPVVSDYYSVLSDDREKVSVSYRSELNDNKFDDLLQAALEKDRILQHTTVGIHRDDLKMQIGGYPIRKYGSQGQQKSFLIALKLAQFEIIAAERGYKPSLLLDDIFDKLDIRRVERLIRLVSDERFGQIFITDSNKVRLEGILFHPGMEYKLFSVHGGVPAEESRL